MAFPDRLVKIDQNAFENSGIKSFVAPASLREIGVAAFADCDELKEVKLNEGIQKIGVLCFSATPLKKLALPEQIKETPEELGIGRNHRKIRALPDGLETVTRNYPIDRHVQTVVVPASVRELEDEAFCG